MARIEGITEGKAGLLARLAYWLARRRVGKVPEPLRVYARHTWLLNGYGAFEYALERSRLVEERLKLLAQIKAATLVGCPF